MPNLSRIGFGRVSGASEKALLLMAVICGVVADPEGRFLTRAEYEMPERRSRSLQALHVLAVVAQLQQEVGFRVQRQLRVDDLVTPRPMFARGGNAAQEVGAAEKRAVEQRRLIDDRRAARHRVERFGIGLGQAGECVFGARLKDDHSIAVLLAHRLEVAHFVRVAFSRDQFDRRARFRPAQVPRRDLVLEPG